MFVDYTVVWEGR